MILAGIDEAGYGPLLGPLVVGCCAFEIADAGGESIPCLWKRLRKVLGKKRSATGRKLHVNDSKIVYSPAAGLKELERSVLAIAHCLHGPCDDLDSFLSHTARHALADLAQYAWYRFSADESFPIAQDRISVNIPANALNVEMRKEAIACIHLAARLVCEKQLNIMFNATRNKANALFSISAIHLDHLLRTFGHRELTIVCDRQGGRLHYGPLLRLMFEEWALQVVEESDGRCEYRLARAGHVVRLFVWEKAEEQCLSVAAAAMLSKYLREALMRRFNVFWNGHLPQVSPTAGYYNDGLRFLRDIQDKRHELGITDHDLIRSR